MQAQAWAGTIRAYAQGLLERQAGRANTLAQLYAHLGHPVQLLGSHFTQWGRELWEPIRGAVLQQVLAAVLVDSDDEELLFVGEREPISLDGLKRLCHGMLEPRDHDGQPAPTAARYGGTCTMAQRRKISGRALLLKLSSAAACRVGRGR